MLENINLAFQGVWSHKMRSFLTMLGIIIGIAAIITIVSTIQGTNEQLTQDGNEISLDYSDIPQGVSTITEDMRSEMSQLGSVADVSLYHQRQWPDGVYVGDTSFSGSLYGIDSHFLSAADYAVNYGRSFVPEGGAHRHQERPEPVSGRESHRRHSGDQRRALHRGGRGVLPRVLGAGHQQHQ